MFLNLKDCRECRGRIRITTKLTKTRRKHGSSAGVADSGTEQAGRKGDAGSDIVERRRKGSYYVRRCNNHIETVS